jgi:hypothetical protein
VVHDKIDAQILQVLRRQAWQDILVDRIVAECSLMPRLRSQLSMSKFCPLGFCQRQFLK